MGESRRIRVVIADDHPIVRDGLRACLLTNRDMELVGEAAGGEEAVRLCEKQPPDVVVMDLKMPGFDGLAATRAIRARHPQVEVVALTSYVETALVLEALQAGVIAYLVKNVGARELSEAIRAAHGGRRTLAPEVERLLIDQAVGGHPSRQSLTKREREVLALMVKGLSNRAIAQRLMISASTARFHVSNILSKLGVSKRGEAAHLAIRYGLVSAD